VNTIIVKLRLDDPDLIEAVKQHSETNFAAEYELKSTIPVVANNDLLLIFQRALQQPARRRPHTGPG
jgi:hypothetical protein